jgi:hypothetical protein
MNVKLGLNGFTAGLIVGVALLSGAGSQQLRKPEPFGVELTASGSDMSQSGVTDLTVTRNDGAARVLAQRCNGACDDVQLKMKAANDGVEIKAQDASGRCVACTHDRLYVTHEFTNQVAILGAEKLELRWTVVHDD